MSKGHRHGRDLHPVRAAAGRRRAEGRRAQTSPGAPLCSRLRSCEANVPACGLAETPRRICAATPAARAVGRPATYFCAGSTGVDASSDRPPASLGDLGVGLGAGVGDCV